MLVGLVERITYQNVESGAAAIAAGEWITATGNWVNDRTHGQQFKARFLKTSMPTSVDGIERYLASGMICGIGPVYAKKLLNAFSEKVFDVIEAEPDRLREVDGIGPVRAGRIIAAWAEQKVVREIMVFLHTTVWARRVGAFTRPTAPCRLCRRTPIVWRATSVASGSERRSVRANNTTIVVPGVLPSIRAGERGTIDRRPAPLQCRSWFQSPVTQFKRKERCTGFRRSGCDRSTMLAGARFHLCEPSHR
jgi:hypothetical protein